MKSIYKYTLLTTDETILDLPLNSEILSVKEQLGDICIWVKVDLGESTLESRKFVIYGTGHKIDKDNLKFIDTVLLFNSGLVLHVFEHFE